MGSGNSVQCLSSDERSRLTNVLQAADCTVPPPAQAAPTEQDPPLNEILNWQCIRVFVSSTFADMFAEREYLVKAIFPRLREWCAQRRLRLVEVDLRWGVPADSTSESILRACLEEIVYCKEVNDNTPFFINMLGHRYGWAPSCSTGEVPETVRSEFDWVDGASVTTMELLCGALRLDNPNALCLIRGDRYLPHIPDEFRLGFVDSSWVSKCALDGLKNIIRKRYRPTGQVVEYEVTVDGVTTSAGLPKLALANLELFGDAVYNHLTTRMSRQYPGREGIAAIDVEDGGYTSIYQLRRQLTDHHDAYCKTLNQLVLGRDEQIGHFLKWLNGVTGVARESITTPELLAKHLMYICVGDSGVGKSAMVACSEEVAKMGHVVLFHSAQSDDSTEHTNNVLSDSSNILSLLIRVCIEIGDADIQNIILQAVTEASGRLDLPDRLVPILRLMYDEKKFKAEVSVERPSVIFIDETSKLAHSGCSSHFLELFLYPWPMEIRFVCGIDSSADDFMKKLLRMSEASAELLGEHRLVLDHLREDVLARIITQKFAAFNKRLSSDQLQRILSNPGCSHLGWLSTACEEIRLFGAFETLTEHISQLPATMEGLVDVQLSRLMNTLRMLDTKLQLCQLVRDTLLFVAISSSGLRDSELRELLCVKRRENDADSSPECVKLPYADWSVLFFWTKLFLRVTADTFGYGRTRLVYRNYTVKKVTKDFFWSKRASEMCPPENQYQKRLADLFYVSEEKPRFREEYPFQILELKDSSAAAALVRSDHYLYLDYITRVRLVNLIRCKEVVMKQNVVPELMCLGCSMKMSFNRRRLNRSSCCVCGSIIHSHFQNSGLKCKVILNISERFATKCRKHSKLPMCFGNAPRPRVEKCMLCPCLLERQHSFSPVVCSQCNERSIMLRCCHVVTDG